MRGDRDRDAVLREGVAGPGAGGAYRGIPLERIIDNPTLVGKYCEMSVFNKLF